jgi:ATP-dependent DNA helicase RecQ
MPYNSTRAIELLRLGTQNPNAAFRDGQEEAIRHVVDGLGRLLVVQKTGWGKSSVYFIATKLLREQGMGPVILISPLLALMRNQIPAAERMGVRALTVNSGNKSERSEIEREITQGEADIILIHPKQLVNDWFNERVLARIAGTVSMVVIDEAHCISDWGHDFVPEYRLIERRIRLLPPNVRVLATTATANNRVMTDLQAVLGPNLAVSRGDLNRSTLLLQTIRMPSQAERLAWLATQLPAIDGSGIIYALTPRDAERVAEWLKLRGLEVEAYHGRLDTERANALEDKLLANEVQALVATTKLGMGFDKPDLAFVFHFQMPGSVVAYYQQVGRAGRNIPSAYGVLLSGDEDRSINDHFIGSAFPTEEEVEAVLSALDESEHGLSVPELMTIVNASKSRIEKSLLLMSLESPAAVFKDEANWKTTANELSGEFWERARRLTSLRRAEQQQMRDYLALEEGHMEFLISALDGDPGGYVAPAIDELPAAVDEGLVQEAEAFLRRTEIPIEPRKRWPVGGLPLMGLASNTNIAAGRRAESGKVLCYWGNAGWGAVVRRGKYQNGRFSDDLVAACVAMVRNWNIDPAPQWVTCIPSLRHPDLVPDFAERIAAALNLPFVPSLRKTDARDEQKNMANSTMQALNIDGSLEVLPDSVRSGTVLLIDDMVDSRWTLTVAAYLLRAHGSGLVYPLALATTANAE